MSWSLVGTWSVIGEDMAIGGTPSERIGGMWREYQRASLSPLSASFIYHGLLLHVFPP